MTDYCTLADIKARLSGDVPTMSDSYDDDITDLIGQVSSEIDREIAAARGMRDPSYSLVAIETATARRYSTKYGSHYLPIDDCVEIDSVVDNGTTLVEGTDYVVEPLTLLPIVALIRISGAWSTILGAITVTARWGYAAAAPEDIKKACITETVRAYLSAQAGMDEKIGLTPFGSVVTAKAFTDTTKHTIRTYGQGGGFLR